MDPTQRYSLARRLGGLLLVVIAALAPAQAQGLRFCAEDENSYPWMLKERPGLNQVMMDLLATHLGQRIHIERQPWRRCLLSLKSGWVDGAFKASYSEERLANGRYPMKDGKLDLERRMLDESYHLYRRKGSAFHWDGRADAQLAGTIGAQAGFSVVKQLRALGFQVDEGSRVPEAILTKLRLERIDAAALQTQQGDHLLRIQPLLGSAIERMEPALASKPYFLMLSHQLATRDPQLAERIWDGVATVREGAAYRQAVASFK
jgi:polar amino acid transport system substrate-binding protein